MSNTQPQAPLQGIRVPLEEEEEEEQEGNAAAVYEETHVHGVYEAIAPHFSATRHKPWPFVSSFLASQPPGSIGLDVGCGNGKNMGVNQDVVMLGCDRSAALVALARDMWCTGGRAPSHEGHGVMMAGADVAVADGLHLPFREASADFVICIAVIHHLSTRERRVDAIRRLLRCIRRNKAESSLSAVADAPLDENEKLGGGVLVYVWALEQSSSRRGWDKNSEQDLLVPWVMKAPQQKKKKTKTSQPPPTSRQKKQELSATAAGHQEQATNCSDRNGAGEGRDPSSGEGGECMQGRRQQSHGKHGGEGRTAAAAATAAAADAGAGAGAGADANLPAAMSQPSRKQCTDDNAGEKGGETSGDGHQQQHQQKHQPAIEQDKTFHRFYHLYKEGELEEDVLAAGGQVLRSGYERDNWWVIAR